MALLLNLNKFISDATQVNRQYQVQAVVRVIDVQAELKSYIEPYQAGIKTCLTGVSRLSVKCKSSQSNSKSQATGVVFNTQTGILSDALFNVHGSKYNSQFALNLGNQPAVVQSFTISLV